MGIVKRLNFVAGVAALAAMLLLPCTAKAGEVRLDIRNGLVTLVATDATPRQIMAEWARVGRTRVVNGDRIPGGPVSLELSGVPERQALATILRSVSGYMAAPRAVPAQNASAFDRILVLTAVAAATPARAAQPSPALGMRPLSPPVPQPGMNSNGRNPAWAPPDAAAEADDDNDAAESEDEAEPDEDEPPAQPAFGSRQPGMPPVGNQPPAHPLNPYAPEPPVPGAATPTPRAPGPPGAIPGPGSTVPGIISTPVRPASPAPPKRPGGGA